MVSLELERTVLTGMKFQKIDIYLAFVRINFVRV